MRRHVIVLLATAVAAAVGASSAAGAQLVTIATPSHFVDPAHAVFNAPTTELKANVLLPDGYEAKQPLPVLFLLHGAGDMYSSWAAANRGAIAQTARGLGAIIVMPEAGKGFYTDWFNGGRRGDPAWQRFYLDELIPLVQARFAVLPGRRNHAIAGLSMGGMGATFLASQRPDYFGSASTFSGFVEVQRPEVALGFQAIAGVPYDNVFGPRDGFYAAGHNPTRLVDNLRWTRTFVSVGDGVADPGAGSGPSPVVVGGVVEAFLRQGNQDFVRAARGAGVDVTYRPHGGVHDWPYWRSDLRAAIRWDPFQAVPEAPERWTYTTVAQHGRAWSLRYDLAAAPEGLVALRRDGDRLSGTGAGTIALHDVATGCGFTATLPFDAGMPADVCGRMAVSVGAHELRAGRRTALRVAVVGIRDGHREPAQGATVRLLDQRATTDARGVATLRVAPPPGARRLTLRVAMPGLAPAAVTLAVHAV